MDLRRTARILARTAVAVALGVSGTALTTGAAAAAVGPAITACKATITDITAVSAKGTRTSIDLPGGDAQIREAIPSGSRVIITFDVVDDTGTCTSATFSLATYRANLALMKTDWGKFLATQQFFDGESKTLPKGTGYTISVRVPASTAAAPTGKGCTNTFLTGLLADQYNGNGGPAPGNQYASTCDGRPSLNGNGGGAATGRPCQGCVGNADNKNPKGQRPNGGDANNGYECDGNNGIGKGNPAHTNCSPPFSGWQLDFYQGPLLKTLTSDGHGDFNKYAFHIGK